MSNGVASIIYIDFTYYEKLKKCHKLGGFPLKFV
jgi:hypothetical protein